MDAAPFCGREAELVALEDAWRAVRAGEGPRAVVLLGDRGLGKTRLVQAFYARAGAEAQPDGGYWPAALGAEGRNLQVVPDEGAWRLEAPMPFLWWGVRLADPHGHNHPPAGVLAGAVERDLLPHLDAVHREQRRRARRAAALGVGRGVVVDAVADVVVDLIPFGGLLKTLGETGRELHRIAQEDRRDRGPTAAADLTATRRQGLVDKLMADLQALLGGPEGARVPAVLVVDDAQFAPTDPGVTAFVEALVPAAVEGGWPLLLVVTSWVREWLVQRDRAHPSVASALRRWGAAAELRLAPVSDLTPAVRAAFPGLHDDQAAAVADRAGGNPRLLDELLRYLGDVRRRPSFVGRDPKGPLTDAGLAALARHTGDLHQLVAERLAESPEAVQHAVALAAGQGSEFLPAVVRATAIALAPEGDGADRAGDDGAVGDALAAAEHPHAFVTTTGPALAAFVQRVYAEVAREFLDALVDPEVLATAVQDALRTCAAAGLDAELPADAADGFYALVATTFERAAAADDRRLAAQALRGLVERAVARDDLTGLAVLAPRLADVLDGLPETHLDGDLRDLREAAWVLGQVGETARQRAQLLRWFGLVAETFEEHRDDPEGDGRVAPWVAWMVADAATAIGDFHGSEGEEERAITAYRYALHALSIVTQEHDADHGDADAHAFLETAARLHAQLGAWTAARAEFDAARHHLDQALELRTHLETVDPGEARSWARAAAWCQRARLGLARGEPDARDPDAWARAVDELRVGHERLGPEALDALVGALRTVAVLATWRDDAPVARAARSEELALRRARLETADDRVRRADLAVALRDVALQAHGEGDLDAARRAADEAVALLRPVWDGAGRTYVREVALRALVTAGELAHAARDADAGRPLAAEALALGRELLGPALDPAPLGTGSADAGSEAPPEPAVALWITWLEALALAAPHAAVEGPAQAEGLFAEAEAAFARVPEDARWAAALPLAGVEEVRARWLERAGATDAAEAARRRVASLRGSVEEGAEGRFGAFGGGAPA